MRLFFRLLPIILVIALLSVGCGKGNTSTSNNDQKAAEPANEVKILKLGSIANPDQPTGVAAQKFAELVEKKTAGKIKIEVYPTSQLGGTKELQEKVSLGSVDMAILSVANFGDYTPEYKIVETPFVWRSQEHLRKVMDGQIGNGMAEKYREASKARILSQDWNRSPRELLTVKPVNSVDDVRGLKIRIPSDPVYTAAWQSFGTVPTSIALKEVYTAFQQKVVEGVELPIDYIVSNSFYEIAKHLALIDYIRGTQALVINEKLFSSLPKDLQDALMSASLEAAKINNDLTNQMEEASIKKLQDSGVKVTKSDVTSWKEKVKPVYTQFESQWGKGLYEQIQSIN